MGVLAATLGVGMAISLGNGLSVAHAEPGPQSADPSSTDDSGDTAASSIDTTPATEPDSDPPQADLPADDADAAAGDDDAATEPGDTAAPQMEVESSGGANTSTNDTGQNTDDGNAGAENESAEEDSASTDTADSDPPVEPADSSDSAESSDSGPSTVSSDDGTDSSAPPAITADEAAVPDTSSVETMTTLSVPTPPAAANPPVPYVAPNPLEAMLIEVPRNIVTIATTIAGLFLTPFLAPGPVNPAEPPLLWVVLGWIRHEINRTFFNRSAVVRGQEITLALGSGDTSDPISFNAYDGDGDRLIYHVPERGRVGGPMHGTVMVDQVTGTFTYTPDAGYTGPDQFTVSVSERPDYLHMHGLLSLLNCHGAHTDRAKIRLNVVASSTPPVAIRDSFDTSEDTDLTGNVLDNDTGDGPLSATLVSGAAHGSVNLNADGSFSYTPNENFSGVDSFSYTASDGQQTSATAVVTVVVTPVNDAPVAVDDAYTVTEGGTLSVPAAGVLSNDGDADGDVLGVNVLDGPTHGTLVWNVNGSFVYKPDEDFAGTDTFTYMVSDGALTGQAAMVTITVTAVPDPTVANDDNATVNEDTEVTVDVLGNDSDPDGPLTIGTVSQAAHGTVTTSADGKTIRYTPDANYVGADSFTYTVTDGTSTATATVSITVTAAPDPTVADDDSVTVYEDSNGNVIDVLGNDSDPDGPLTIESAGQAAHGTVTISADGKTIRYTPNTNYSGTDSFTYTVTDGTSTATATVSITVTAAPDPTTAGDDTATVNEDTEVTIDVLGNDSDPDGALTIDGVGQAAHGTVTISADGKTINYTPNANYVGADSFTYTVTDGTSTATATVSITVTAAPDPTTAGDDTATVNEDTEVTIDVLGNDSDPDGPLTIDSVGQAAHGTVTISADGKTIRYTPNTNYSGTDSFTYTVTDGTSTATATVSITVAAAPDPTVADDDSVTVDEDSSNNTIDVLGNDSDPDGPLTIDSVGQAAHGTVTISADGKTIRYTPDANYTGADSFTYTVTDGTSTATATVSITVNAENDAPVANSDSYTVTEDGTLNVSTTGVLSNDSDVDNGSLTAVLVNGPSNGTLTLNLDGSFTYIPNANFNGTDTFTYRASDGTATGNLATVTITVTSVNDAPTATDDSFTVAEDGTLNVVTSGVLTNDADADETGSLTAILVTGPSNGTLTLNPDGTFTYTPNANFNGADTFTYRAFDGTDTSNLATVSINVTAINDAPVANDDSFTVAEDGSLGVSAGSGLLANDTDVENGSLSAILVTGPSRGSLILNPDGSFTYTPATNYNGTDTFTYRVSDGTTAGNAATVTITITSVNDVPVATNDSYSTNQGTVLNVNAAGVLTNDSDPVENSSLTAILVAGPSNGTLTLNSDGSFIYTPNSNFSGTDSFTYRASDGTATSNMATVTITVVDNLAPTAATVQTTNIGGTNGAGVIQEGDTISFTFSEPINPTSIKQGWDGTATNVYVRAYDGNILLGLLGGNDTLQIFDANGTQLPLGTVEMGRQDYVTGLLGGSVTYGATGTSSKMVMSGNTITITLGTYDSVLLGAVRGNAAGAGTMVWTPATGPTDFAGNALTSTAAVNETGAADEDF